jgi:hypothetical protein
MRTHWAEKRTQGRNVPRQAARHNSKRHVQADMASRAPTSHDTSVDRFAPLDVELAWLGQLQSHSMNATSNLLRKGRESRAFYPVKTGYAQRLGHGVGFNPDGRAKLRDKDASCALETHLGISGRSLSYGHSEGVVIGQITIALGKQTVIDRGVGIALAPAVRGQELSMGHVNGTERER